MNVMSRNFFVFYRSRQNLSSLQMHQWPEEKKEDKEVVDGEEEDLTQTEL
jgi:hypothetical protein